MQGRARVLSGIWHIRARQKQTTPTMQRLLCPLQLRVRECVRRSFRRFAARPQERWDALPSSLDQLFAATPQNKLPCPDAGTCTSPGVRKHATTAKLKVLYRVRRKTDARKSRSDLRPDSNASASRLWVRPWFQKCK